LTFFCFIISFYIKFHTLRSGFKTSDQVQGQGAGRSRKRSIHGVCEHLSEVCNAAIGPQMGF
jgi:hypothetical protein